MSDVYERLQVHLDNMVSGFPATESRVEIRLLEKLFEEVEAELFLKLMPLLETPDAIAKRLDAPVAEIAEQLETMATRGLLFRHRKDDTVKYAAVPYVVGLFEFQLNRLTEETARDMETYFHEAFGKTLQAQKTPIMRTVPINREIAAKWPVAPYDDVLDILDSQKTIALAACICRKTTALAGKECDKPLEACMIFGTHADYYVENGLGRYISVDEAKAVAGRSEEAGLVMQPFNSQKIGGMCSCCGCCCGMLRSLKMQPSPAESVQSNYFAAVDADNCTACETCIDRCQMDAITMADEVAVVDRNRCIGCGLCVTTCPTDAMFLEKKEAPDQYVPPRTGMETYINITAERGKI